MSLQGGSGKLAGARKDLGILWDQTKVSWHDANARAFEKQYLEEWDAQLHQAHRAMTALSATFRQLERDCG